MIELRVLGQLSLRVDGRPVHPLVLQRKRLLLFVYLLLGPGDGFHERSSLKALFWPEFDEQRAQRALRKSLHFLRNALGRHVIVARGRQRVGVAEGAVWCDALAFRTAATQGNGAAAVDPFTGDLLPAFDVRQLPELEAWLEGERSRLRHMAYGVAMELARDQQREGGIRSALHWTAQAERAWPESEEAAGLTSVLLHASGNTSGALHHLGEFSRRLERDLGVRPGEHLCQLTEAIRSGSFPRHACATPGAPHRLPCEETCRHAVLFSGFPEAVFLMDSRSTLRYVNRAAERLTGYTREELIGQTFAEVFVQQPPFALMPPPAHLRDHAPLHLDLAMLTRDGRQIRRAFRIYFLTGSDSVVGRGAVLAVSEPAHERQTSG